MNLINLIKYKKIIIMKNTPSSRVISFSVPPLDKEAKEEVLKLKEYCKKSGLNFSHIMIKAIKNINKELNL